MEYPQEDVLAPRAALPLKILKHRPITYLRNNFALYCNTLNCLEPL